MLSYIRLNKKKVAKGYFQLTMQVLVQVVPFYNFGQYFRSGSGLDPYSVRSLGPDPSWESRSVSRKKKIHTIKKRVKQFRVPNADCLEGSPVA